MEKVKVYRINFYFPPLYSAIPFILAFLCIFINEKFEERFASTTVFFRLIVVFLIIAILGMLIVFANFMYQFKFVIVPFYSNRYLSIIGMVCNLVKAKTKKEYDTFEIEGVHFVIGKKWMAGLQKTRIQGGPAVEEGQYLNVFYVKVRSTNIIVSMEILVNRQ